MQKYIDVSFLSGVNLYKLMFLLPICYINNIDIWYYFINNYFFIINMKLSPHRQSRSVLIRYVLRLFIIIVLMLFLLIALYFIDYDTILSNHIISINANKINRFHLFNVTAKNSIKNLINSQNIDKLLNKENNIIDETLNNELIKTTQEPNKLLINGNNKINKLTYQMNSGKRPWFLKNGTLMPTVELSQNLALWPDEGDPHDDRVINQLMYMPPNYQRGNNDIQFKTIYLLGSDRDWRADLDRGVFHNCPVNSCKLVNESDAENADAIFFKVIYSSFYFSILNFL
jgi:hypothetical protein